MPATRRSLLVYALLAGVWLLVVGWQVEEHARVREAARTDLRNRSKDIAKTVSVAIRSMRFFGAVRPERLDSFLDEMVNRTNELVKASEILGVELLNAAGERVAFAGRPIDLEQKDLMQAGERWGQRSVTLINPVDLGSSLTSEGITNTFVLPRRTDFTNRVSEAGREFPHRPPPPDDGTAGPASRPPSAGSTNAGEAFAPPPPPSGREGRPPREGGFRSRRPPWFRGITDEKEYQSLVEKRALHGLILVMSTEGLQAAVIQDLWLRSIIFILATVSVLGSGLAWRNVAKTSELQIRLMRASDMNTQLKEMNLAAAGLAHETRNPLNIIRGLAQMISKQPEAAPEIRQKSREIIDEADKVAAQLNEFINYSRPREVRRTALPLTPVINEVARALNYDLDEKKINLEVKGDALTVEADEQLLRQALFNLLLNAIQAVDGNGRIEVLAERRNASEAVLEVRDNGPGVPPDRRLEIFKPYFTTQKTGTGLGLAVVHQIVLAHGWEIQCLSNEPRGAVFRISHLRVAPGTGKEQA